MTHWVLRGGRDKGLAHKLPSKFYAPTAPKWKPSETEFFIHSGYSYIKYDVKHVLLLILYVSYMYLWMHVLMYLHTFTCIFMDVFFTLFDNWVPGIF